MPYANNEALPDAIKNALPEKGQDIWRNAFNSAHEKYPDDEERCNKIAWVAVKNAGFEKDDEGNWVSKKDHAALSDLDVEVFSVGTWNGDTYSASDLDGLVDNFAQLKEIVKPPVKLGHNKEQMKDIIRDGQPALGWVKALRRQGDKLIATLTEVPRIVQRAIKAGLYKRVSSEVYWNYKNNGKTYKHVFAGLALLGADIPAVTNLADLEAFLSQSTDKGSFDKIAVYKFAEQTINKTGEVMDEKQYQEKLEAAEQRAKEYKERYEAIEKKQLDAQKTVRFSEFKTFCESQVKEGRITPAAMKVLFDKEDICTYSDEVGYMMPITVFQEFCAFLDEKLDSKEHTTDGKKEREYQDCGDEINQKAREYASQHNVDYGSAVVAVLRNDPELAERYYSNGGE